MKRCKSSSEDCDEVQHKEPRLQETSASSSAVKNVLRRSIELKQAQIKEDAVSKTEDNFMLRQWAAILSDAGYYCDVRSLENNTVDNFTPLHDAEKAPSVALIVERSRHLPFSQVSGPFQAARLVIYPNGEWRLDSPVVEYRRIEGGMLSFPVESQLVGLARKWLSEQHVMCPGLVDFEGQNLEEELGYIPKNVSRIGKVVRSVNCKVWHIPTSKFNYNQEQKICTDCLAGNRYVKNAVAKKQTLGSTKREERRNPGSNYPIKYLSPRSKSIRLGNTRKHRSLLTKRVRKLYKQTRVELPQEQSSELCKLVEEIEKSNEGRQELQKIFREGNAFKDAKGCTAGNCVKNIWEKDRESFFKDQKNNGENLCDYSKNLSLTHKLV